MDIRRLLGLSMNRSESSPQRPCVHAADPSHWETELWQMADVEPDDPAWAAVEQRMAECAYCAAGLRAIVASRRVAEAQPGWTVPQIRTRLAALERARTRKVKPILRTVISVLESGLRTVLPEPSHAPAPARILRRRAAPLSDPDVTYQEKISGDLLFWLEVEKTGTHTCRLTVGVEPVKPSGGEVAGRANLEDQSGILYETCPFEKGEIVFDDVAPGEYLIRVQPKEGDERVLAVGLKTSARGRD